jgi:hypothetical protein
LALAVIVSTAAKVTASPSRIEFEGYLVDRDLLPLPDGSYDVVLKIYSDPNRQSPLWETDGPVTIDVRSGFYTYVLGSQKPLPKPIGEYDVIWVGTALAGAQEVGPRTMVRLKDSPESPQVGAPYGATPAARPAGSPRRSIMRGVFPDLYIHAGVAFGLGSVSPGESYEQLITPWQTGTGISYGLSFAAGFRNIYQFQFTPRRVTSSDLNRVQADSVIPLDYHVKNEMVHKLNLLCFRAPDKARMPVIFLTYGTASTGSVRQVDKVGTGFVEGSAKMIGVEAGLLGKSSSITAYIQRRATRFRSFYVQQIGTFQEEVEARFWSFGIQIGIGTGLNFH